MEEYKGYDIEIEIEEVMGDNPREWDCLGILCTAHNRYDLNNETEINFFEYSNWDDVYDELEQRGAILITPIYMLDHSGIWISTKGFRGVDPMGWDSGCIGYAYTTKERVRKELGCKYVTGKRAEQARVIINDEITMWGYYLSGEVYRYTVKKDGEVIDSCGGFYGPPEKSGIMTEARDTVDYDISHERAS